MKNSDIKLKIDQYINGELSDTEIDQLFIEFLEDREWFRYYQRRERFIKVKQALKLKKLSI